MEEEVCMYVCMYACMYVCIHKTHCACVRMYIYDFYLHEAVECTKIPPKKTYVLPCHARPPWLTLLGTCGSSLTSAATPVAAFGFRVVVDSKWLHPIQSSNVPLTLLLEQDNKIGKRTNRYVTLSSGMYTLTHMYYVYTCVLYIYIYIYIYVCVCVCACVHICTPIISILQKSGEFGRQRAFCCDPCD